MWGAQVKRGRELRWRACSAPSMRLPITSRPYATTSGLKRPMPSGSSQVVIPLRRASGRNERGTPQQQEEQAGPPQRGDCEGRAVVQRKQKREERHELPPPRACLLLKEAMPSFSSMPPTPTTSCWSAGLFIVPKSGPSLPMAETMMILFAEISHTCVRGRARRPVSTVSQRR